mgnify:CR=1 FL=1
MSKWIKRIFITLAVLIVLVLAAAIILPYVFRDKIEAAVKLEVNKNINAIVNWGEWDITIPVSYTHLRAHETVLDLVCRLLLEKKKT